MGKKEELNLLPAGEREFLEELQEFMEKLALLFGERDLTEPGFFRVLEEVEFKLLLFMEHLRLSASAELFRGGGDSSRAAGQLLAGLGEQLLKNAVFLKNFRHMNQKFLAGLGQIGGDLYQSTGKLKAKTVRGRLAEEV